MAAIQWFPGHMAKTNRELAESVRLADLVIEVLDARIPASSGNPDFRDTFADKRRLVVFNKADLADAKVSAAWKKYFKQTGTECLFMNARSGEGVAALVAALRAIGAEKLGRGSDRGRLMRPVRAIVAGVPNSGKSSLINRLSGSASAKTGDRPGVTRHRQWFRVGEGIELLDTPGILWPKFEDETVGLHLAYTGAIKDEVIDAVEVAETLLEELCALYPALVEKRYGVEVDTGEVMDEDANVANAKDQGEAMYEDASMAKAKDAGVVMDEDAYMAEGKGAYPLLGRVGRRRGFLSRGGEVDIFRAAAIVLDEFRAAKLGRITLEHPDSPGEHPVSPGERPGRPEHG